VHVKEKRPRGWCRDGDPRRTGPFVRGDAETVRLQLKSLSRSPGIKAVYVSLAEAALQNLPHQRAHEIRSALRESLQD